MKIKEIEKDLFLEKYKTGDIYAHCISADFVLGKGIAKTFKEKFPELKKKKELVTEYRIKSARRFMPVESGNVIIGNLITKKFYYSKPTYGSLTESLVELRKYVLQNNLKRILMPKIGCGLDRLDWELVKQIIEKVFEETDIEIKIFYI